MPKRILIADDDPGIVDAVEMMLDYHGYEVKSTYDGNDVLNLKDDELPDVLLLDIWMSGCDGRDICKELKSRESTRHVPVLMVSASKDIEQSAIEAGADGFLAKPFEMHDLLLKLQRLYTQS